jgi:lytic murein transglycosylase
LLPTDRDGSKPMTGLFRAAALAASVLVIAVGQADAQARRGCETTQSFDGWLDGFRRTAAGAGISARTIDSALDNITPDPGIIAKDRRQGVFRQSFEQFSGRMVSPFRLQKGAKLLGQHHALLARIEQQYGVPGPVLVAIWGLETDFGVNRGNSPTLRALVTLAWDCRRSAMFQDELLNALRIVDRGDLRAAEMRGGWAGELGQTQFMPSSYVKFAVDGDGNGRRDLLHSPADVLASTANYLKSYGWQRGQPWRPGTPNFNVLQQWNKSEVYSKTVAYFASRLAGT